MIPNLFCGACKANHHHHQRNLKMNLKSVEPMSNLRFQNSDPYDNDGDNIYNGAVLLKPNKIHKNVKGIKKNNGNKISNFSDLIHRVTPSCLLHHPVDTATNFSGDIFKHHNGDNNEETYTNFTMEEETEDQQEYDEDQVSYKTKRETEMVMLLSQVFETVSFMKKAYISLQEAHSPWDPDKIRLSDMAVVAELRKLAILKDALFRPFVAGGMEAGRRNMTVSAATLREIVAPYEAEMENLRNEMQIKAAEVDTLKQKLKIAGNHGGRKSKSSSYSHQSKRRVSCSSQFLRTPSPDKLPELFESCMDSVKENSSSFASLLLSLMKSADWDITATVNSITNSTIIGSNHAKYAVESYVNRKMFQGFDHETFYMTGNTTSFLNINQFRSECFTQYSDMKSIDPMKMFEILQACEFGKFCSKKYLSIVHPKMEGSLFGDLEQRREVLAGNHPRSRFYREFLGFAKAVWMLHLIAFSLDPFPSHFEGSRGADFRPEYMESAARFPEGRVDGGGLVVGFPVSPGFKLENGYIVKARVYLVPNRQL